MDDIIPQDTPQSKQCRACNQVLPLTAFSKHKNKLRSICRTCASQQYKSYYQTHKEERSRQNAQWEQEHKEERSNYYKQYNQEHREQYRAHAIRHYYEHIEEKREYRAQYNHSEHGKKITKAYQSSPRGKAVRKAISHKRRIAKLNSGGSFTAAQFQEQIERQHHRCYYCQQRHAEKDFVWHADHVIPLSRDGSNDISNIVAACQTCNQRKYNKLPHEWPQGGRLI